MTRTRLCFFILLLTPLLVYWQTIFTDYGFRDDYSGIREAREEQGKTVRFTASHGRPLYGALLETSLANIDEVGHLWMLRFAAVVLLTLLAIALWRQLYHSGWTEIEAAVIGLGVVLLPGAQIVVSWVITWPHAVALLLSLAGFAAIESELERGGLKRAVAMFGGALIYALAAMIYQSNALFAVVPMAAILLVRTARESSSDLRWARIHFTALFGGLMGAYLLIGALFANGIFHASARMQLEFNPFTKLIWFFSNPLPNALALYALRDDFNTGAVIFWSVVVIVAGVISWGCRTEIVRVGGVAMRRRVLVCAVAMPFLAHFVSLAAAERSVGYRTLVALSGLVLVMLVFALRSLRAAGKIKPVYYYGGLFAIVLSAVVTAHFNSHLLIAVPQSYEWETMRSAVMRANFPKTTRIYIVTPTADDRATGRFFADEFGSISSDSDWVPTEMFKAALHERYPVKLPKGTKYTIVSGRAAPDSKDYDLVIDMREYKQRAEH
jgi:hypothetical protein